MCTDREPCPVRLDDISGEVFLWYGELDVIVPCADAEFLASRIPNCKVTIWPDEGHIGIARHWDEILEALAALKGRGGHVRLRRRGRCSPTPMGVLCAHSEVQWAEPDSVQTERKSSAERSNLE